MLYIRQGATHKVVLGPAVAVGDGFTPVTTLALSSADEAEVILHDNGTVVDISGYTWAAITTADGYYHLTLQSGISGTVGHMTVVVHDDSLVLPLRQDFTVLEEAVYDALFAASAPGYVANAPVNVAQFGGANGTFAGGRAEVNVSHWSGTAVATPTQAGVPEVDVTFVGGAGVSAGAVDANVVTINGQTVTASGGITFPAATLASTTNITAGTITTATNLTNAPTAGDFTATMKTSIGTAVAASAVASVTGNVGGNVAGSVGSVTGAVGSVAAGGIAAASFATTAGAFHPLNVVDQGTAQSATGTTLVLRAAAAFADDELIGARILITGGDAGVGQSRLITDYVAGTDTATVSAWTTTPTGTITYKVFSDTAAAGGSAPTAAEVADAVWDEDATAHQSQGSFGQAIGDPVADANTIYAAVVTGAAGATIAADLIAVKAETASILLDTAEIGAAGAGLTNINLPNQTMDIVGNITGNLSGSVGSVTGAVGSVTGSVGSISGVTFPSNFSGLVITGGVVSADVKKLNGTTLNGDGSATPWGP